MALIEARNIWKIYGEGEARTVVLKGINLKIEEGEFVAIMGPSGCGKSTLLNILGLLDVPTKGMVYIKGKKTSSMSENERAIFRRKISGFIFQQFHLINTLTALENVELPMMLDEKDKIYRFDLSSIEAQILQNVFSNVNILLEGNSCEIDPLNALRMKINNPRHILKSEKKQKAIEKARMERKKQILEKIENSVNLLKLYNKRITIYSIAKEANISYQTIKKIADENENIRKIIES